MTKRDKYMKRPAVVKYRIFATALRECMKDVDLSDVVKVSWTAYFPIPESWSNEKKSLMRGQPHRQKPDRDNVDKAILDALFEDDSGVSDGTLKKRWDDCNGPRIEITCEKES